MLKNYSNEIRLYSFNLNAFSINKIKAVVPKITSEKLYQYQKNITLTCISSQRRHFSIACTAGKLNRAASSQTLGKHTQRNPLVH
jgi:hypothetical protein